MSDDLKKYLPKDMQAGLAKRATTASLRRLNHAARITEGLRPAKFENAAPELGKRWKTILLKISQGRGRYGHVHRFGPLFNGHRFCGCGAKS